MTTEFPVYQQVGLDHLSEELARLRLCDAAAQAAMERSLLTLGQITPLLVRVAERGYEVLDGFKRLRAARALSSAPAPTARSGGRLQTPAQTPPGCPPGVGIAVGCAAGLQQLDRSRRVAACEAAGAAITEFWNEGAREPATCCARPAPASPRSAPRSSASSPSTTGSADRSELSTGTGRRRRPDSSVKCDPTRR